MAGHISQPRPLQLARHCANSKVRTATPLAAGRVGAVGALAVPWDTRASTMAHPEKSSSDRTPSLPRDRPAVLVAGLGIALFLFIPVVLYLLVAQPRLAGGSLGWALGAGVALMLGHRFLARPYMRWARLRKCLWCGRVPPREAVPVLLETGKGSLQARCCARHRPPTLRFFGFTHTWRWPLRLAIFVPLLLLVATMAAAALGVASPAALAGVTDLFRLSVGLAVNLAAWGYLAHRRGGEAPSAAREGTRVAFPAHNFFLLGVGPLLWIFRLVGIWWIWIGARGLAGL